MKNPPLFAVETPVKTPTGAGLVRAIAEFADHFECLVELPDGTASWLAEAVLVSPSKIKPH